jgi:predicted O-methyltransferase YrrM
MMEHAIESYFPALAAFWDTPAQQIERYWQELCGAPGFLAEINDAIADVPDFAGVRFTHPGQMRVYRSLLYLCTRALRPVHFVETGVQNGMSSAYVLLAMAHNGRGHLHSIDLPPIDERILAQGTNPLPGGKSPGWLIPRSLRDRHSLTLAPAEEALPPLMAKLGSIDVFLHDSDHSYEHVMFEAGLVWRSIRPNGCLIVDNIEQNAAFADFARGVGAAALDVASFDGPDRVWRHGLMRKAGHADAHHRQ